MTPLARIGSVAAEVPGVLNSAISPGTAPQRCEKRQEPRDHSLALAAGLVQAIGADGMMATSAANLVVGLIIGFLGVSQLGRWRRRRSPISTGSVASTVR